MIRIIIEFLFYVYMDFLNIALIIFGIYAIIKIIKMKSTRMDRYNNSRYFRTKHKRSIYINREYYQSTYYLATKNKYEDVMHDKGLLGEYKIFQMLQPFENYGARFLFNCYLPREHNETTEIDVILLTYNGIFVIESKNYNGWIYGDENQDLWTQMLPAGKKIHKTHFYNPIRQNKTHIKYLKKIIGDNPPIYSIIVFSNECTLKSIEVFDPETKVTYLGRIINTVQNLSAKTPNSISQINLIEIYNRLYPYTQVSETVKMQHIENINNKIGT